MANFFEQQAHARSATTRLVALYILAVVCICAAVGMIATFAIQPTKVISTVGAPTPVLSRDFTGELIAAFAALLIIGIGTLVRMRQLGGNGTEVALLLGGVPIDPASSEPMERRLLNVVEEMAIASGIPVPRVFILKDEKGINAFAAGMRPGEAVIGVTRGTLEQLNRDELQGVVAHEFSHIFNGDMRLNLRLMGVLGGILALTTVGRIIIDSSSGTRRSSGKKQGNGFIFIGFGLIAVGWIGVFFARLIKAAVSRQREYLADASAVQYTRNPIGIGGALMKISGMSEQSKIKSAFAEEASHMFFGTVKSFTQMMATHPPIEDRIKRISPQILMQGGWTPRYENSTGSTSTMTGTEASTSLGFGGGEDHSTASSPSMGTTAKARAPRSQTEAAAARASAIVDTVGAPSLDDLIAAKDMIAKIPEAVRDQLRTPIGATSGVLALLLQSESGSAAQAAIIKDSFDDQVLQYTQIMHREMGEAVHTERLMILELAIPALRNLEPEEQRILLLACRDLVHADGRYDLFEYVALTILDHQFSANTRKSRPRTMISAPRTTNDLSMVISAIAHSGTDDITKAKAAFDAGIDAVKLKNRYPIAFRSPDECRLQAIADAVDRLSFLEPASQKMVVDACVRTVIHDKVVNQDEAELLKAICTVLEAPLPALAV